MPLPSPRLAYAGNAALPIDQPRYGAYSGGMLLPVVTIHLGQRLIPPPPSNTMFHHDPSPRKGPVIADVLRWAVLAPRFAPWCRSQAVWMQRSDPDIRQVPDATDTHRQPLQQGGLRQQGDVGGRAWNAPRHIHDLTRLLIDRDLTFERVALFFPL